MEENWAAAFRCKKATLSITYLGMPLGGRSTSKAYWFPVLQLIEKRLAPWKRMFLSKGRSLVLIKTVFSSILIYFMVKMRRWVGDCMAWSFCSKGIFFVKSFRRCAEQVWHDDLVESSSVWNGFSPSKVEVFMWQLMSGRLMVRDVLVHFGVVINSGVECPLCKHHVETSDHLFLLCPWDRKLWSSCMSWQGVSFILNFQEWFGLCPNMKYIRVWVTLFSVIALSIWEARNQVLFKGTPAGLLCSVDMVRIAMKKAWSSSSGMELKFNVDGFVSMISVKTGLRGSEKFEG
ncbi:hypothetical protein Ddye_028294 [Dipteronia dyeriana]|uniref:Reverse transcriptase zinc-binding domain-containing protein n=1 Tax=Dipteronia dyeriana TaxID=168575 RepID=A0AAD9WR11_9ROSI|nr:hypothetical protein Ddye_028294 [Dipteronia dyeriana]